MSGGYGGPDLRGLFDLPAAAIVLLCVIVAIYAPIWVALACCIPLGALAIFLFVAGHT